MTSNMQGLSRMTIHVKSLQSQHVINRIMYCASLKRIHLNGPLNQSKSLNKNNPTSQKCSIIAERLYYSENGNNASPSERPKLCTKRDTYRLPLKIQD